MRRLCPPALPAALALALVLALWSVWPAARDPDAWLVGNWVHPDMLSNHWLLVWVAEQVSSGGSVLHNDRYYWPVGDAPVLAGNGNEGFLYLPLHLLLGFPAAGTAYVVLVLTLNGLAGWVLARAAGAGPWSSLIPCAACTVATYTTQELSSGRFTQVSVCWLLFFLASWLRLLSRPSVPGAVLAAVLLAVTSFFYWYYGWFGVLAGAVLLVARLPAAGRRDLLAPLAVFAGAFVVLIGPWLWTFLSAWSAIPGTDEIQVFPHPQSHQDAVWPHIPFLVDRGRHVGQALAASVWGLGLAGAALAFRRGGSAAHRGLVVVWVLFTLLAMGPLFPGAPYTLLYGLAAPLRRFWWPLRHVALSNPLWAVLAAMAATWLGARLRSRWSGLGTTGLAPTMGLLLALSSPVLLGLQVTATRPSLTPLAMSEATVWTKLAAEPPGVLLEPPLAPEVAGSQQHLFHQLLHQKPLVTGHALWVSRVRPQAWDAHVAENSFLAALQALERGQLGSDMSTGGRVRVQFEAADLDALRRSGLRWVSVDRVAFTFAFQDLVKSYHDLFDGLFGDPVAYGQGIKVWDAARWAGRDAVEIRSFDWPADAGRTDPDMPRAGRRPQSPVLGDVR